MPPLDQGTPQTEASSAPTATTTSPPEVGTGSSESGGFDMEAGLAEVERGLGFTPLEEEPGKEPQRPEGKAADGTVATPPKGPTAPAATPPAGGSPEGAPRTWTKEAASLWGQVPPQVQQEISRREGEMVQAFQQLDGDRKVSAGFQSMLKPYAAVMEQYGVNPWKNMTELLDAQAKLVFGTPKEKVDTLLAAVHAAGLDLNALISGSPNVIDERYSKLQNDFRTLQAQVGRVSGDLSSQQAEKLEAEVWAFARDEATHPFFWDVAADIAKLTARDPSLSMENAYETAVWANPVTRQKAIEAQTAKAEAERSRQAAAHAASSRKATSVNVNGTTSHRAAANADEDLETTIRASLADIRSREG